MSYLITSHHLILGHSMGGSNMFGDDSFLAGAVFMSNRATKKECLSRKLFGLPSFHASFVEKIKMGMILFLFEYEERKLYGVFEATSDGALNIVPMAFRSSGKLFSAQVSFRTIWCCPPLTEGEFFDAIQENYYAPNKFNLHLSGKQVCKLLELFDLQKQCGSDYKSITQSRHSRNNGGKRCQNFMSGKHEPNKESSTDVNMYSEFSGTILDLLTYHKRSLQNVDNANVGMEAALQPPFSPLEQPEHPEMVNSVSRSLHALRGNIPSNPEAGSFYQQVTHMCLKRSSISSGMNSASLDEVAYSVGSLDSHPSSRYQNYYYPGEDMRSIGVYSNLQGESSYRLPTLASNDSREGLSFNNLQGSIGRNFSNRVSSTIPKNSGHSSSPRFNDHYAPDISSPSQRNYTQHHLDVAKSLQSPDDIGLFAYGHCAATSQFDEKLKGSKYFRLEPHEIIRSPEYEPNNLETMESTFCSSPEKTLLPVTYSSGCSKYQDELSSYSYLPEDDEYYTAAASPILHSDNQKRTSVFLRLSELKKAPVKKVERYNPDIDVSLDELVSHISSKQKYWCRMTEVPTFNKPTKRKVPEFRRTKLLPAFENMKQASHQSVMFDNDEQLENMCQLASEPDVLCNMEQSLSQEGADVTILPFLNFKRRSEAQRKTCGTDPSNSVGEDELCLVKHKRRKLIRPSFGEEAASTKVDEVQNVTEETRDLFLKEGSDSNESVDATMDNGNKIHRSSCGVNGASQQHLTREVQDTLGENVSKVRLAAALQMDLRFEGSISIKDDKKFHNAQESSQDLHGCSLLVVGGNNSRGDKCDTEGGQKMEMGLSHSHNGDAKYYAINIASGEQCSLQNMDSPCEQFHVGPLFVKVGDSTGIEKGVTSYITGSGSERRHKPKDYGECKSCSCYSGVVSKRHACQTSASDAQGTEAGKLSSNVEATEKSEVENISEMLHLAEFDWKNTMDPHRSMPKAQEQDTSMKDHFTESDSDITGDSQCNLFKTAVEVGRPPSSSTDLDSAEASRDAEEKVCSERDQGFDNSAGKSLGICGKKPFQVVDNEMKASHQDLLSATKDI